MSEALRKECEELTEKLLTFIETCGGRKLKFSSIVNRDTGKTENPTDRITAQLMAFAKQQRAEVWREAKRVFAVHRENISDGEFNFEYHCEQQAKELDA